MQTEATKTQLLSRAAASPSQPRFARQLTQRESPWQSTQALLFLPKLFPFRAVDLRSTDREKNPPKQKKGTATRFCAAASLGQNDSECPPRALWASSAEKYRYKSKISPAVRSQYRSTPSLVTRAYTSGASSGFSAPYTRPLRYSAAAASNLSAAP